MTFTLRHFHGHSQKRKKGEGSLSGPLGHGLLLGAAGNHVTSFRSMALAKEVTSVTTAINVWLAVVTTPQPLASETLTESLQ